MSKSKIVFIPGTWDILHFGHIRMFKKASEIAKVLIAGVNTDQSVLLAKGNLPIQPYKERVEVLEACMYVDKVVAHEGAKLNVNQLKELKVDVVYLGGDWEKKYLPGEYRVKQIIEIKYFPYIVSISGSKIKKAIVNSAVSKRRASI